MKLEVKVYICICEFCNTRVRHETADHHSMPEGWGKKTVGGFGLTGYSKDMDCCDVCNLKKLEYGPNETFGLKDTPESLELERKKKRKRGKKNADDPKGTS